MSLPRSELGTYRSQEELLLEAICLVRLALRAHANNADDEDHRPTFTYGLRRLSFTVMLFTLFTYVTELML